jgi:hypothetical protein
MNFLRRIGARRHPHADNLPYYYTPGPVFTEPAEAAIFNTTLALPLQRILGAGVPVQKQLRSLQPQPLFSRPAAPIVGLGGTQAGQYALAQLTGDDGTFADVGEGSYAQPV